MASDGLLVLGGVPGLDQVYVATGDRDSRIALDAFAPGRFARRA